jgi:putative glutamine amidotransferase
MSKRRDDSGMAEKYPIIGIGANVDDDAPGVQNIYESYVDAVYNAGCLPLIIPLPNILLKREYEALADRAAAMFDGLMLSGGNDVNAMLYGEENMPFNGSFSEERDLFETALAQCAARLRKPILGICRGVQMLNVAMGGTLFQDIERQNEGTRIFMHRQKAPSYSAVHSVTFSPDSEIAGILLEPDEITSGAPLSVRVNSFHHQAVRDVAPGFTASAHSGDGIIEAIEPVRGNENTHPFTIGVQWHPERMWKHHRHAKRLFTRFAEACKGKEDVI